LQGSVFNNHKSKKKRLGFAEFKELCGHVFKYVEKDGKRSVQGSPEGCESCEPGSDWDCENCMWRENYWKYDEIEKYVGLVRALDGGFDLNRIKSLDIVDFQKISIVKEYMGL